MWFVMLDGFWTVVLALLLLSLSMMVIFFCSLRGCFILGALDTVCISRVKGYADEGLVHDCRVREQDTVGNDAADEAADFGRRRV